MLESIHLTGDRLWARMERAVEKVHERLHRAVEALKAGGVPYAVVGGLAVRVWVAQVDETAVRNTRDVDLLVNRNDLEKIKIAMAAAGFVFRQSAGLVMFLDSPDAGARDAVHLVFAGEMVRKDDPESNPALTNITNVGDFQMLDLETLVRMKLNSFRLKDRVHLVDMIELGVIDQTWTSRFPEALGERLKQLIENPDG